jgi:6-phosphogluconolactonase
MKLKNATHTFAVLALACAMAGCGSDGSTGAVATNSPTGLSSMGSASSSKGASSGSDDSYTVGGTVTGLAGTGLVLEVNGTQSLVIGANGTFSFAGALSSGSSYVVTVQSQPSVAREICSMSNGSGTVGTSAVNNVGVSCATVLGYMYELDFSTSQIYSYGIDTKSGNVIPLGAPIGSGGEDATSILASADGHYVYVTNQTAGALPTQPTLSDFVGNIATFAVNADTGQLTLEGTPVAAAPFTEHSATAGRFLFVFNTYDNSFPGINFPPPTLMEYILDPSSGLPTLIGTPLTFATEDLFFAMAVSPNQQFLYVLSGDPGAWPTITVYVIDPSSGALTAGQSTTVNVNSNSIVIDPHGRFLYLETGGDNPLGPASATILPYAIDPTTGSLSAVGSGTPVATNGGPIVIDPTGSYLYAVNSLNAGASQDTIQALNINQSSGILSTTGPIIETDGQIIGAGGLMFDPSGEFLYLVSGSEVSSQLTGTALTTFTVSAASGSAGQLVPSGAPQQLPIGFGGWSIAIVE